MEAFHIDNDRQNCNINNLKWATYLDNIQHKVDNKRQNHGETHYATKFTEKDVLDIYKRSKTETRRSLAAEYDVNYQCIVDIIKKRRWKHILNDLTV